MIETVHSYQRERKPVSQEHTRFKEVLNTDKLRDITDRCQKKIEKEQRMKKCKKEYEKKGKQERASGTRERDAENTRREREREEDLR